MTQKGEVAESEEQQENGRGVRQGTRDEGSVGKDLKVEKDDKRERVKEEKQRLPAETEVSLVNQKEQEVEMVREEEHMEVTEEGQSNKERAERVEEKKMEDEEEGETAMDQSENLTNQILHQPQNMDLILTPEALKDSSMEPKPIPAPVQTSTSIPVPGPVPEVSVQSQRLPESHRDLQPVTQEDFCENMSTQSDNQSGTFNHTPEGPSFTCMNTSHSYSQ